MRLIEVSGEVASALGSSIELRELIGDRYFPVVVNQGVKGYPFVTYRNLGVTDNSDKDTFGQLSGKVEIEVAAETFEEVSSTSGVLQDTLERWDGHLNFTMANYEEEFDIQLGIYVSVLTFNYDED